MLIKNKKDGFLNRLFYFCTMNSKRLKRNMVLGVLFFLPVSFLLFLYPSTHNYNPLDIVNLKVNELENYTSNSKDSIALKDHLTVLAFFGNHPMENAVAASNLKELVYDKFKGFKRFQIVVLLPNQTEVEAEKLFNEISQYEDLRFWHFIFSSTDQIKEIYRSLKTDRPLDQNLSSTNVFIIDKDLNQRGRLDDRTDKELQKNIEVYSLYSYNCVEVAEIKNKMSEDLRILFTEYRQKRKGNFDSSSRRENDIKKQDEKN